MVKNLIFGTFFLFNSSVLAAGALSFGQIGRMNTPLDSGVDNQFIQIDVSEKKEAGRWDVVYQGSLRHYTGDRGQIISVPEAYVSRNIGKSEYTVGRKIINWQKSSPFWAMGEISPLKNFSLLEQDQEGFFGLHFERKTERWGLMVYASGINIPQINPTFSSENGTVTGKNEWSYPPPSAVRFRDNDIPIFYTVEYPEASEIVLQNSAALKIDYTGDVAHCSFFGGVKPEPGIRINATGFYDQGERDQAVVKAKPFVNHHYFWGSGCDKTFNSVLSGNLEISGGVEGVIPQIGTDDSFEFQALKIQPVYERITYLTAQARWSNPYASLSLNSLYLADGDTVNTNVFAEKPRWRRAVGGQFSWDIRESLSLFMDYKYDIKTRDMAFLSRMDFRVFKHVSIGAGIQVLDSPDENSFWAPFRSNDSVIGQMAYLF
jgi:hypothetical protein